MGKRAIKKNIKKQKDIKSKIPKKKTILSIKKDLINLREKKSITRNFEDKFENETKFLLPFQDQKNKLKKVHSILQMKILNWNFLRK
jgi:hypothetical protein